MNADGALRRLIQRIGDAPRASAESGMQHGSGGRGSVEPEDPGHWYAVEVATRRSARRRRRRWVIVEVTKRPQGEHPAQGGSSRCCTTCGRRTWRRALRFFRHDLPQEFPPEVMLAGESFAPDVPAADLQGREDLRHCRW